MTDEEFLEAIREIDPDARLEGHVLWTTACPPNVIYALDLTHIAMRPQPTEDPT